MTPHAFAEGLTIDNDGVLHAENLDETRIYEVNIEVTDDNEITGSKTFVLSDNLIFDYTIQAGDDYLIGYGEEVHLDLQLTNTGTQTLPDLEIQLELMDPYVDLIDFNETVSQLTSGQTIEITDAFSFQTDNLIPDEYPLDFNISFSYQALTKHGKMHMLAFAPDLDASQPLVADGDNGRLDPGESTALVFPVFNAGHADALDVEMVVESDDSWVSFTSSNHLVYGNIPGGNTVYDTIFVSVAAEAPEGHQVVLNMDLTADPGIEFELSYVLVIGRFPVMIIDLDPQEISGPLMSNLLDELGIIHSYFSYFNEIQLEDHKNLMVFLGRKFNNHVLTTGESDALLAFLESNGNIYLEGGVTWLEDPQTALHGMFNLQVQTLPWETYDTIYGVPSTFSDSMKFEYSMSLSHYDHFLLPSNDAFAFMRANEPEHGMMIACENPDYKTIGSKIDFAGLEDGQYPSTKKELLRRILAFLDVEVLISDLNENLFSTGPVQLHCYPNPVRSECIIAFTLMEQSEMSITLSDMQGNVIKKPVSNKLFPSGAGHIKINASDMVPGIYICTAKTGLAAETVKFVKIN